MAVDTRFTPHRADKHIGHGATLFMGLVEKADDPEGVYRVRVRIPELGDGDLSSEELPWCAYAGPRHLVALPLEGEPVSVVLSDPATPMSGRYWLSRMYSHPSAVSSERGMAPALRGTAYSSMPFATLPPSDRGEWLMPGRPGDVWVVGRDDAALRMYRGGAELSAGRRSAADPFRPNRTDPAFLRLSHGRDRGAPSHAVLAADRLVLQSGRQSPHDPLLFDDGAFEALYAQLHPLPKGDVLVQVLEMLRSAVLNHHHRYNFMPAEPTEQSVMALARMDMEAMLSENIRIN